VEPASSETGQVDARPAETDQVEAEPVQTDSVESAPVEAEPLEPAPVVYDLIEPVVVATPNDGVPLITSLDLVPEHGTETGSAADGDVWEGPSPDEPPASGPPERAHLPGFDDLIGFDDLLSGNSRVVAPSDPVGPPPPTDIERAFDGLFDPATPEPAQVDGTPADLAGETATESESVGPDSGSIPAASAPAASAPATSGPAVSAPVASAPAEAPIVPASVPVAIAPALAVADRPQRTSVFAPERSGIEPTPMDQRVGRAARMFWLWFATNSSLISLAFGGVLLSLGMSLRQAIVAALIGVAIAFLPLGLGTLAGKWSGQPTMIVSRASFGLIGNIVPASLAVITRVFWGAVLLWLAGASAARILVGNRADGTLFGLGETKITALAIALGFVLALAVAVLGYPLFARVQLVLTIVSAVLIVAFIVVSWHAVDVTVALTVGDGPWILVLTGAVLVVSFLGVVWATSSADLARYQRPSSSGAQAMLWAPFGATLPAFLLIAYGALLAASSPKVARGLVATPLDTIASLAPGWFPTPLLLGTVLSLLVGVVLSIYSGGFALQAVGLRVARGWSAAIVGVLVFVVALVLTLTVGTMTDVFRDLATTLAVPVAAWAGIFAAEMILRRRRFDTASLVRRGGTYPDVNWVNLAMLIVASAVGFGLTTATVAWLGWQGYLFGAFGIPLDGQVAASDLGVLVALLLGLLTPFVSGVPAIRKQERQPRYFV
ncbi:MAG: cytosine permease, partial [Lacisediminihabitans sp.]